MSETSLGSSPDGDPRTPELRQPVLMYTLVGCVHCIRARGLLARNGVSFEEQPVELLEHGRQTLRERTGGWTAPQIVIGDRVVGGADALARLDRAGALGALFQGERFPRAVVRRRLTPGRALVWLLAAPFGGTCDPRVTTVDLIDERGRRLERRPAPTREDAERLAAAVNQS